MKQPVQPRDGRAPSDRPTDQVAARSIPRLTSLEKDLLECLGASTCEMTLHQIQNTVRASPDRVAQAVERLVDGGLISKLNTVVPAYQSKYPGVRVYGD